MNNTMHKLLMRFFGIPKELQGILETKELTLEGLFEFSRYFYSFQEAKNVVPPAIYVETYENILAHIAKRLEKLQVINGTDIRALQKEIGTTKEIFAEYFAGKRFFTFNFSNFIKNILPITVTRLFPAMLYIASIGMFISGILALFETVLNKHSTILPYFSYIIDSTEIFNKFTFRTFYQAVIFIAVSVISILFLTLTFRLKSITYRILLNLITAVFLTTAFLGSIYGALWISSVIDTTVTHAHNTYMFKQKDSKTFILGGLNNISVTFIEEKKVNTADRAQVKIENEGITSKGSGNSWLETNITQDPVAISQELTLNGKPATYLQWDITPRYQILRQEMQYFDIPSSNIRIFLPENEYIVKIDSIKEIPKEATISKWQELYATQEKVNSSVFDASFQSSKNQEDYSTSKNIAIGQDCYETIYGKQECTTHAVGTGYAVITITRK